MTNQVTMTMTAEEARQFEAFQAKQREEAEKAKRQADREAYKVLVDETLVQMFPKMQAVSETLSQTKAEVYQAFEGALKLKGEAYGVDENQRSHTFTDSTGRMRIIIGSHETDGYDDTVNEGIAKVKSYIESLASDANTQMLVRAVLRLLAKDASGSLKASRVMQLRKMAEESGSDLFIDGVNIIEQAYRPTISKRYVRAERRGDLGEWINIPLGMTEA